MTKECKTKRITYKEYRTLYKSIYNDSVEDFTKKLGRIGTISGKNDKLTSRIMHLSVVCLDPGYLRALATFGGNIEIKDGEGNTLLHKAVKSLRNGAVRILHELGADMNAKDKGGLTALDWIQNKVKKDISRLTDTAQQPSSN